MILYKWCNYLSWGCHMWRCLKHPNSPRSTWVHLFFFIKRKHRLHIDGSKYHIGLVWWNRFCVRLYCITSHHDKEISHERSRLKKCGMYFTHAYFNGDLTHWGRVTHICVGTNTNIGSDNGLSPGKRQAIIWTNAGILLIGPLGRNFSGIVSEIHTF